MDSREISRQLQQLEAYITSVVAALIRKELPVNINRVVQIFDATFSQIPSVLDLPEGKFVEVYNDVPNVLTAYALDATLSEESYRQSESKITFNRFPQGNYWIIHSDRTSNNAWLVPNPLRRIEFDRLKSIEFSFDRSSNSENKDLVVLVTPAIVQLLPMTEPLVWKLVKRGQLSNQAEMPHNKIDKHELTNQIKSIVAEQLAEFEIIKTTAVADSRLSISDRSLLQESKLLSSTDINIDSNFSAPDNLELDQMKEPSIADLWRQSLSE